MYFILLVRLHTLLHMSRLRTRYRRLREVVLMNMWFNGVEDQHRLRARDWCAVRCLLAFEVSVEIAVEAVMHIHHPRTVWLAWERKNANYDPKAAIVIGYWPEFVYATTDPLKDCIASCCLGSWMWAQCWIMSDVSIICFSIQFHIIELPQSTTFSTKCTM